MWPMGTVGPLPSFTAVHHRGPSNMAVDPVEHPRPRPETRQGDVDIKHKTFPFPPQRARSSCYPHKMGLWKRLCASQQPRKSETPRVERPPESAFGISTKVPKVFHAIPADNYGITRAPRTSGGAS